MLTVGLGGGTEHGCVAVAEEGELLAVCEQERITRTKRDVLRTLGTSADALGVSLGRIGRRLDDVGRCVVAETALEHVAKQPVTRLDHHRAHASTAFLTSPFPDAATLICDREAPQVTAWRGTAQAVAPLPFTWVGEGPSDLYSKCASVCGFAGGHGEQRFEALARLRPGARDARVDRLLSAEPSRLILTPGWESQVESWLPSAPHASGLPETARIAATLQSRIIDLVLEIVARLRHDVEGDSLCLGGSLFYHSSIITAIRAQGLFRNVFVPIDPGNAGLAVGTALHESAGRPRAVTPFLGPEYSADELKETLDNCKLSYSWESDTTIFEAAVRTLNRGGLVGWFDGPMEWGPRALGNRSILASPFSPFVLENLNRFLKRRESWRGYALSGLRESVASVFEGPSESPFMECDYRPRDARQFRHVLSAPEAALRVQTVGPDGPRRFSALLEAFEAEGGAPVLVNTSFNGFHEPIVCSPRDAIRVFYGSGLDLLVLGQFLIEK